MGSFEIGAWEEGGWNDKTNEAKSLDYGVIGNWFADDLGKLLELQKCEHNNK